MMLLTKEIRKTLPPLYSQEEVKDPIVQVKFFTPWTQWTWYGLEFDGTDIFYGWIVGQEKELGYFSLKEMESVRGPYGLKIERDRHFHPTPLSVVKRQYGAANPRMNPRMAYRPRGGMWGLSVTDAEMAALAKELGNKFIDEFVPVPNRKPKCKGRHAELIYWETPEGDHGWACSRCGEVVQWGNPRVKVRPMTESRDVLIARWETRGKRYWCELYRDGKRFYYRTQNGGGNLGNLSKVEAVKMLEARMDDARRIDGINYKGVYVKLEGNPRRRRNLTYAQEMKSKYGYPFDPSRVKSVGGFRFGQRVVMASDAESWQSGVPRGATGTVSSLGGRSVSPDPMGKMIVVDWDKYGTRSVWKGTLQKTGGRK